MKPEPGIAISSVAAGLKATVQRLIRAAHLLPKPAMPAKLGIYFHNLPRNRWDRFAEMVHTVRDLGYRFVDLETHCADPGNTVYLSFDDNHVSWFEALPLFEELGVMATFYTNTLPMRDLATQSDLRRYVDRIGGEREQFVPLSTSEIGEIARAGHVIGAHTHTHPVLTSIPLEQARAEMAMNKERLEDVVGSAVDLFAFPYGMRRFFSSELEATALEVGFSSVAYATPGWLHQPPQVTAIQRTGWNLDRSLAYNLQTLRIDGRAFERFTGRSAVGP